MSFFSQPLIILNFSELENKIHAFAATMKGQPATDSSDTSSADTNTYEGLFPDDEKEGVLTYKVTYSESCAMPDMRALVLLRALGKMCEVIKTFPEDLDADNAGDEISKKGLYIKLITDDPNGVLDLMKNAVNVDKAEQVKKPEQPANAAKKPQPAQKSAPEKSAPKPAQPANAVPKKHAEKHEQSMISVKLDKLNRLLDLVAEIVITEGSVISSPDLKKAEINLDRFNKSSRELKKLTDELQDVVMSIRMVPVSTAFQKMNRVVRDMNQKLKKNVTLVFEGQETEVDKSIVDILNDPLMHIVRNAVDHGIEDPEVRAKAGKTEPATVTLSAGYDSNEVVISCLEKVGGKLYVDSKFGEGSVFTIRIPLSLSILDVLSVDVGGENFSLPVSAVSEAFSCKAESFITDPEGNEFIMLREKCLPLIRMSDHFDIPNAEKDVTKGIMLCCKDGGKEAVLMADRITVDQQVVVKPFSPLLDAYPLKESGMAGCSVLGDGSITIILDMKEFLGNYDFRKGE